LTDKMQASGPATSEDAALRAVQAPPAALLGELDSEEKVRLMAAAADSVRAADIIALDLRDLTIIADFFLICTGNSSIQIRAVADRIEERLRERGIRKSRVEGYQEATWILLDYGDVVAHIMAAEQRAFYNLEEFWSAAPRLELELAPESTPQAAPPGRRPFDGERG
jgi:ribosome-associated protein